jgi:hypothetical protein
MMSAITPAARKNRNDVARYIRPIFFASVVRSQSRITAPGGTWRTGPGYGRIEVGSAGRGASVAVRPPACGSSGSTRPASAPSPSVRPWSMARPPTRRSAR